MADIKWQIQEGGGGGWEYLNCAPLRDTFNVFVKYQSEFYGQISVHYIAKQHHSLPFLKPDPQLPVILLKPWHANPVKLYFSHIKIKNDYNLNFL